MEPAKLIPIPNKFAQNFKEKLKEINTTIQLNQEESYFEEIYTSSFDSDKKNETIQAKLACI